MLQQMDSAGLFPMVRLQTATSELVENKVQAITPVDVTVADNESAGGNFKSSIGKRSQVNKSQQNQKDNDKSSSKVTLRVVPLDSKNNLSEKAKDDNSSSDAGSPKASGEKADHDLDF